MSVPGRSPQDDALRRAIRQLEVSEGPSPDLDQRIRAKAHAAVRRRRGLPLWLSAVASVFVVFFAASLWRHQAQAPLPSAADEATLSVELRKEGADAAQEETVAGRPAASETTAPARSNESEAGARGEQAAATGANAAAQRSALADDESIAPAAELSAPTRRQAAPAGPSDMPSEQQMAPRQRVAPTAPTSPAPLSEPKPAPPPAPASTGRAVAPAEPRLGSLADTAKSVAPARSESVPTTADRLDAVEDEPDASGRAGTTSATAVGAVAKRELAREPIAGTPIAREAAAADSRAAVDRDAVGELSESFPIACLADSAGECFDQVRRLRDEGRRAEAVVLLRETLERFDAAPPEDLRALLE
jgi:hypothetical protein